MDVVAWSAGLVQLWSRGWSAASNAWTFAATLPPTCRQSLAHAAATCGGLAPTYFAPGFAPFSLGWGWFLLGVLLGASCGPSLLLWVIGLLRRAQPSRGERPRAPGSPAPPFGLQAHARAAAEVMRCVALGGEEELLSLASAAGRSPEQLLGELLMGMLPRASPSEAAANPPSLPREAAARNRRRRLPGAHQGGAPKPNPTAGAP